MAHKLSGIEVAPSPKGLEQEYQAIFTEEAVTFLYNLVSHFRPKVDEMLWNRKLKKLQLEHSTELPDFDRSLSQLTSYWEISPLPERLHNRRLDLGDIAPSNTQLLLQAIKAPVEGIQVDFDDGNCPSWRNQILGIHNLMSILEGTFFPDEAPPLEKAPLLLLRPRAWNMNEHNVTVHGKEVPGPLLDFGLLIFHLGKPLLDRKAGPYFYLPKLENAGEARVWDEIFCWAENILKLPHGSVKACVLIENILAAFETEQILYELRHHSFGLNCGIWDYSASIINKLGGRPDFVLPDRGKYVNLDQHFLQSYMKYVISVCKKHGAPVTGGMIPLVLDGMDKDQRNAVLINAIKAKKREVQWGANGFLTYDISTIPIILNSVFESDPEQKPVDVSTSASHVTNKDFFEIPSGGVTSSGLLKNIKVGILFIYSWLSEARGHFILDGAVEDSATAEISRSQVWQWILHETKLENGAFPHQTVTKGMVSELTWKTYAELVNCPAGRPYNAPLLETTCEIFLELVTAYEFPEFMTTYLYNHSVFRKLQDT